MSSVVKGKDKKFKLLNFFYLNINYSLGVVIVGAKRTPFGTYGGKFVKTSACDLQTVAAKAALASANVKPELVDTVTIGNVLSVSASLLLHTVQIFYFIFYCIYAELICRWDINATPCVAKKWNSSR